VGLRVYGARMKRNLPAVFAVACLIVASLAWAQPVGPDVTLPGLDRSESREFNARGTSLLEETQRQKGGPPLQPGGRGFICALAGFTAAVIVGEMNHPGARLSPADIRDARKALVYLNDVMNRFCDRPKGGDVGSGNDGDKLLGFAVARLPKARMSLSEARKLVGDFLGLPESSIARDVALSVAVILAGAATLPSLAVP
jgi:hypothetical protein